MEYEEIAKKIVELREKINEETLQNASAEELANYLVEVDKLTILMARAVTENKEK